MQRKSGKPRPKGGKMRMKSRRCPCVGFAWLTQLPVKNRYVSKKGDHRPHNDSFLPFLFCCFEPFFCSTSASHLFVFLCVCHLVCVCGVQRRHKPKTNITPTRAHSLRGLHAAQRSLTPHLQPHAPSVHHRTYTLSSPPQRLPAAARPPRPHQQQW